MKKILLLILTVPALFFAKAQQTGMYSHWFFNPALINPAFTGTNEAINAMVISRSQWTGFSGAPQLNILSLDGSLVSKKVGLGLQLFNDRKGLMNRAGGSLSYAYHLKINDAVRLHFGVAFGVIDQSINFRKAMTESNADPVLFSDIEHRTVPDGNAGLALSWKGLEIGIAVPQLFGNKVKYVDNVGVRVFYTQARHYMGSLRYRFLFGQEKSYSFTPRAVIRFVPHAPLQYDGNITMGWQDKIWIGATYKSEYAVAANAGVTIHQQLSIGYSYDFIIGEIGKYSGISHEIMLNFRFGKGRKEAVSEVENTGNGADKIGYQNKIDSLEQELRSEKAKAEKLLTKEKIKERSVEDTPVSKGDKGPVQPTEQPGVEVIPAKIPEVTKPNVPEKATDNGIHIVAAHTVEFKDENGVSPKKGYYVVVGTFYYRDLALAEAQRFVAKGYKTTDMVYYGPSGYNYVFMFRTDTKEEALEKITIAQNAGVKDAWIQVITEN